MPDPSRPEPFASTPGEPSATPRTQAAQQARREREAAALRQNLLRRKQQARERESNEAVTQPSD